MTGSRQMAVDLFPSIDRRCRAARPRVRDLRDRAILLERMGFRRAAERDVDALLGLTHQDTHVLQWIMEHHADDRVRRDAAATLIGADRATSREQDAAIAHLIGSGQAVLLGARRRAETVEGWVAWSGEATPVLSCLRDDGVSRASALPVDPTRGDGRIRRVRFRFAMAGDLAVRLTAACGEATSQPVSLPPVRHPWRGPARRDGTALSIVLPVYGDPPSLVLCLAALERQMAEDVRVVVVDDASPDPSVSAQAERFCREVGGTYHRLPLNAGFAAAVNAGLSHSPAGDVLLLNSDVILPPDALKRLRAAAARASDIATVSPLSSDAGGVTFPDPRAAGETPDAADRLAIDRAARRVNSGIAVDILTAHGSCLYVTQRFRDLVGPLCLKYGRGYYEDIDLMLRAHEHGLRNVAACDVFVTHLGSRSFGPVKHALVARNHSVLCRRFPAFEAEDMAFEWADPLRPARAAMEVLVSRPRAGTILVVAPAYSAEALLRRRAADWEGRGRPVCMARLRGTGADARLELSVTSGPGPRSLRFALDETGRRDLLDYLAGWSGGEVELLQPEITLAPLGRPLAEAGHSVALVIESAASARAAAREAGHRPSLFRLIVLDRVAERAVAGAGAGREAEPDAPRPDVDAPGRDTRAAKPVVAVLYPTPAAGVERFILDFARSARRSRPLQILVLGFAVDERQLMSPGNVWVTGLRSDEDPSEVLSHYGALAVVSPYRTSHVWYLDHVASRLRIPGAFFDWSPDGSPAEPDRLALDHRVADAEACAILADWIERVARPGASAAA